MSKQELEQETTKGTHTHTINASPPQQANNTTRATNGNPATRPLYMHLPNTPHTHHTAPCATEAPATDTAARHPPVPRDRNPCSAHTTEPKAPGQPRGARYEAKTPQHRCCAFLVLPRTHSPCCSGVECLKACVACT